MAVGEKPPEPLGSLGGSLGRGDADEVESFRAGVGDQRILRRLQARSVAV
jgi:hypothetical protein